jgi:hypothetical protein
MKNIDTLIQSYPRLFREPQASSLGQNSCVEVRLLNRFTLDTQLQGRCNRCTDQLEGVDMPSNLPAANLGASLYSHGTPPHTYLAPDARRLGHLDRRAALLR